MARSARIAVLLAAAALLALLAWWFLAPGGAGGGGCDPAQRREEALDPKGALLEASPTAPALTPTPPGARRPARPTYTLTVRVLGVAPNEAGAIRLQLSWRGQVGAEGGAKDVQADPSGTTVIDVESIALTKGIHTLQVMAVGPLHLPAYAALGLPVEVEERSKGLDLALEVKPERAGALTGRVLDPDGKPIAGTLVVADVWGGFKDEEERGYGTTATTDEDGRFRLLSRPGARLVALVYAGPYGPRASEPVALRAGETVDVGMIRLVAAQTWVGRVRGLEGLPPRPVGIRATLLGARQHSGIPGVSWTREGPARTQLAFDVPGDGRFEIGEVTTGWWTVSLEAADWGCAAVHEVVRATNRIVHTRDGPLDLEASRARLVFKTTSGGKPLTGVKVILTGEDPLAFTTDGDGHGCIVVRPQTHYDVVAFVAGFQTVETTVTSAANGQESVLALAFEPGQSRVPSGSEWMDREAPRLSLALPTYGGLAPAHVRLSDAEGRLVPTVWTEPYPVVTWRTDGHLLGMSMARLMTPLPPGDYLLRVECLGCRAHVEALHLRQGNVVDARVQIELEPE